MTSIDRAAKRRLWGWWAFDWASQPYNTLLLTFIFGPYVTEVLGDGTAAQAAWGYGVGAAGIVIALSAPFLGAIADLCGRRMPFIRLFSAFYVVGAFGLWWADPGGFHLIPILILFAVGLVGMEFTTTFTNAFLPTLGQRADLGRISGTGWALGYLGGLVALVLMLLFFAEGAETGRTVLGTPPILGLDPTAREGTRAVGPLTAIWYVIFMIPFFLWVRDARPTTMIPVRQAIKTAWPELRTTLQNLPKNQSLFAYLGSSMFYRDALNGMYVFGGIYTAGVLGWNVIDVGLFGILALVTGVIFSWLGGRADSRYGPKPVIVANVAVLTLVAVAIIFVSRDHVFGVPVGPDSHLPDMVFYILGAVIGAAGGALQTASRTMMVRQADDEKMTEGFGLYALAGKATSFIAPLSIGFMTDLTNNQAMGVTPLVLLFLIGLVLMFWVNPQGQRTV